MVTKTAPKKSVSREPVYSYDELKQKVEDLRQERKRLITKVDSLDQALNIISLETSRLRTGRNGETEKLLEVIASTESGLSAGQVAYFKDLFKPGYSLGSLSIAEKKLKQVRDQDYTWFLTYDARVKKLEKQIAEMEERGEDKPPKPMKEPEVKEPAEEEAEEEPAEEIVDAQLTREEIIAKLRKYDFLLRMARARLEEDEEELVQKKKRYGDIAQHMKHIVDYEHELAKYKQMLLELYGEEYQETGPTVKPEEDEEHMKKIASLRGVHDVYFYPDKDKFSTAMTDSQGKKFRLDFSQGSGVFTIKKTKFGVVKEMITVGKTRDPPLTSLDITRGGDTLSLHYEGDGRSSYSIQKNDYKMIYNARPGPGESKYTIYKLRGSRFEEVDEASDEFKSTKIELDEAYKELKMTLAEHRIYLNVMNSLMDSGKLRDWAQALRLRFPESQALAEQAFEPAFADSEHLEVLLSRHSEFAPGTLARKQLKEMFSDVSKLELFGGSKGSSGEVEAPIMKLLAPNPIRSTLRSHFTKSVVPSSPYYEALTHAAGLGYHDPDLIHRVLSLPENSNARLLYEAFAGFSTHLEAGSGPDAQKRAGVLSAVPADKKKKTEKALKAVDALDSEIAKIWSKLRSPNIKKAYKSLMSAYSDPDVRAPVREYMKETRMHSFLALLPEE